MNALDSSPPLVEVLRTRVLRGLTTGVLQPGDRLPSARDLVAEFDVDHRNVLAAYRQLADEELVDIKERGGVYVARSESTSATLSLPQRWFADVFTDAYAREISAPDVSEWLRRSIETVRLRAVVISTTDDQVAGLARELHDDFGLLAEGVTASSLDDPAEYPAALRRADVLVATSGHVERVAPLATELQIPLIAIDVRPDLVIGEWALLLRQPVWAIVATAEFGEMLKRFFANVRGVENLHVVVYGRDDLSVIPANAPTYVTHRVRQSIAPTLIRGRILPPARTIAVDSARQIFDFIVRSNLRAHLAIRESGDATSRRA